MPARLLRTALVLAVLGVLAGSGTVAEPATAAARDPMNAAAASEARLISLTNADRAAHGLVALDRDADLVAVARWRSRDMAERDFFSHDIPGAGKVFDELTRTGYCYALAGENIGWLDGRGAGAEERIERMFLASPAHRRVILGRAWDAIGIGSFEAADGRHFWTVLFAARCPAQQAPG